MKRLLLVFTLAFIGLLASNPICAQNYKAAAGVRLGSPWSASLKYFLTESSAVEAYVGTRGYSGYRWTNLSGAYLVHNDLDIDGLEGLQWYAGAGLSIFFWTYDFAGADRFATNTIGLQGYGGLEYTFDDVPISISADWIPTYFIGSDGYISGFGAGYGTLGVRYIFSE